MIGGIAKNLGQGSSLHDSKHVVLEGDEYDTAFFDKRSKFLHYLPELVVVNNIEFDHADIFADLDAIKLSFRRLLNIVPENGMVLINGDDQNCIDVAEHCRAQLVEVGFLAECLAAHPRRDLRSARLAIHPARHPVPPATRGRVQCAQCRDGDQRRPFLWRAARANRDGHRRLRRREAPAGSARRSARHHHHG
ncbi:MAG: Mur ligase family protein [Chthoniobacter sp.]